LKWISPKGMLAGMVLRGGLFCGGLGRFVITAHLRLRAVRDNGSSGSSRAGFVIGHGRQSAPSPSPTCSYHLNRSDEPPPSGWGGFGIGHGRGSAPTPSALAPNIRIVLTNRRPSGWVRGVADRMKNRMSRCSLPYLGPLRFGVGLWAHTAALRRVWRVGVARRGGEETGLRGERREGFRTGWSAAAVRIRASGRFLRRAGC